MSIRLSSSCFLSTLSRIAAIFALVTLAHVSLLAQSVRIDSSSAVDLNIPPGERPTRRPAGTRIGRLARTLTVEGLRLREARLYCIGTNAESGFAGANHADIQTRPVCASPREVSI